MIRVPPAMSNLQWSAVISFVYRILSVPWREGCQLTSWHRSVVDNRRVGGHPQSQHLLGTAIDVWRMDGDYGYEMARCYDAGLIPINEGTHLHVQLFPAGYALSAGLFSDDVFLG